MAVQCKNVVCITVSTVVPKHPVVPATNYFLSNLDLLFVSGEAYMQSVYYFRTKKDDPITPSIQSLKDSLSELLSVYPVFAGRLKSGKEEGRLEVDVNGEGVPFIEATTEASLDDWPDLHLCDIEEDLNPKDPLVHNIFTAPLLRVQFTSFKCGGIALGLSSLHVITDGLAIIEFLKAWGELHRGAQISTPPQCESIRLRPRNHPTVNVSSADEIFCSSKPVDWSQLSNLLGKSIRCKNIVFRIERPMIDKCIEDVEIGAFSYGKASSFEALSGLLWTAVTRARGLEDSAVTTYGFAVNVRGRLQPPLAKGYFGNAVILTQVTAKAKDIKSNHFSFAASIIHKRLQMVDPEFIQSAIDWVELKLQQQQQVNVGFDTTNGSVLMNTSWSNFPVYEIDFGWRKLDHFEFVIWDSFPGDGFVFILPSHPSAGERSREVKLRLREDHLERLMHDYYFQLYFRHSHEEQL
ncbi:hypothetical protein O6H91_13G063800 [Diphasiastrum complanatum]|uniref:Uncharacterized protein n=2 Tax=Diphasiastrum complanatum TaxID=34168 RepID=A0ACC2BWK1_DIPCM|nr:hypothetical protein O6H91_13G063800 [Diphasiastrum complanatum]KAJ7533763.1 hypothetical protein O6H91_13G063800 [Diphasiastrum complanatum]